MGGDKTEKTTIMVLKVDLECSSCYKKVKKVLCKFPQIRDQVYDEKANIVTINVLCCSPENIRDKLCCKGGGVIKSIEIKEPPKPKESEKPKVVVVQKPKEPEKPKEPAKPKEPEKPKELEKPKEVKKPKEPEKPKEAPKPAPVAPQPQPQFPPAPEPVIVMHVQGYPQQPAPGYGCEQCYESYTGGPCYHWYGQPVQPPPPAPCYDTYSYEYGPGPMPYGLPRGCYLNKCDYLSEENASGCSIM